MNYKRMRPIAFEIRDVTYQTNNIIPNKTPYHISVAELNDNDEWVHKWDDGRDGMENVIKLVSQLLKDQIREYKYLTPEEERIFIDDK